MSRRRRPLVALAALLALLVGGAMLKSLTAQESKKPSEDEQAIRQAVAAYADAFTKGDLDKLVVHLDADAEHIDESGKVWVPQMPSRQPPTVEWREFGAAFLPSIRLFPEWADELPPALQLLPSCRIAQSRHLGRREPGFAPTARHSATCPPTP